MNRHLYRSRDDRMLAGVAGGLAELWDADPSLVRIVWALLVILTGGIALVVYIVMAIVVPEEGESPWGQTAGAGGTPGTPPPPSDAAPAAPTAGTAGAAASGTGSPGAPPSAAPSVDWRQTRDDARLAAREARAARRAAHGRDRSGAVVIGVLLILLGAWFLVREYLPTIDWDWLWPLALVGLGVFVLAMAIRPRSDGPGGNGGSGGS